MKQLKQKLLYKGDKMKEFLEQLQGKVEIIHNEAKSKGWWESPRSDSSVYALFHSEIAEATEQARKPAFNDPTLMDMYHWSEEREVASGNLVSSPVHGVIWDNDICVTKPEGIGVEIIDMVIRVLDYIGYKGYSFESAKPIWENSVQNIEDLSAFNDMHTYLALASLHNQSDTESNEEEITNLANAMIIAKDYFDQMMWNFWDVFRTKHSFNTTRSKRHGGKKF